MRMNFGDEGRHRTGHRGLWRPTQSRDRHRAEHYLTLGRNPGAHAREGDVRFGALNRQRRMSEMRRKAEVALRGLVQFVLSDRER